MEEDGHCVFGFGSVLFVAVCFGVIPPSVGFVGVEKEESVVVGCTILDRAVISDGAFHDHGRRIGATSTTFAERGFQLGAGRRRVGLDALGNHFFICPARSSNAADHGRTDPVVLRVFFMIDA